MIANNDRPRYATSSIVLPKHTSSNRNTLADKLRNKRTYDVVRRSANDPLETSTNNTQVHQLINRQRPQNILKQKILAINDSLCKLIHPGGTIAFHIFVMTKKYQPFSGKQRQKR